MISNHQLAVQFCHGAPVLGFFQQFKNFTAYEKKANPVVLMENVMTNVKQGKFNQVATMVETFERLEACVLESRTQGTTKRRKGPIEW